MNSEGGAAKEYARIIEEISSQLIGDPGPDRSLLTTYTENYRQRPLSKEVLREIGRMPL